MKPVEVSKLIQADVERVFSAFSDLEKTADHITGITKLEMLSEGPVGVGTRWRETRIMFKKEATEEMEITAFDPPKSYRVEAESHGSHYLTELRFEAQGEGATRVTMSFAAEPLTLVAKIMGFIFSLMMRGTISKCFDKDMSDLKRYLESAEP